MHQADAGGPSGQLVHPRTRAASRQMIGHSEFVLYHLYEYNRALLAPAVELARTGAYMFSAPDSWFAHVPGANRVAAAYELLYRLGKAYEKPAWGIDEVDVGRTLDGIKLPVVEQVVVAKPFCRLLRFERRSDDAAVTAELKRDPIVLIVAPLSGHHATLLRDTVGTMLAGHDVYVTDWIDARMVPAADGPFTLDDYVGYVREFIRHIGADRLHVVAVCQPAVPVLAAVSLMAAAGESEPRSLTLMGGSIDSRCSRTPVTEFAASHSLGWFDTNLIHEVPGQYPGHGRRVYPGFLQHAGFMAMNPLRHFSSYWEFYNHLVEGDLASAEEHRRFYDEYNAALDMPGEYYLDCIRVVFHEHLLPRGLWTIDGVRVAAEAITRAALLSIEGERDDISGPEQTHVALDLCRGIPAARKQRLTVAGAGHYGVFSGRRWRESVYPRVRAFIAETDAVAGAQS
jgi:poly(3-hydroxybutyrate) depolymerase